MSLGSKRDGLFVFLLGKGKSLEIYIFYVTIQFNFILKTNRQTAVSIIGGFNQRQGEALPPQIFLTLKFVVWAK